MENNVNPVILSALELEVHYGEQIVLDKASLSVHEEDRIGLVGRNGAGKSTFLKVISGVIVPDNGKIAKKKDLVIGFLSQEFTLDECKEWYTYLSEPYYIIENEAGERVGYFRTKGDEVGCDIHINHRRKGYARQAYLEYLKDKEYASLYVLETNFAKNLYESLGFVETGNFIIHDNRGKHLEMIWKRK